MAKTAKKQAPTAELQATRQKVAEQWFEKAEADERLKVEITDKSKPWQFHPADHDMIQRELEYINPDSESTEYCHNDLEISFETDSTKIVGATLNGLNVLSVEEDETSAQFRDAARSKLDIGNGKFNVDDDAVVSQGDGGAYVQVWAWVSNKQAGIEDDEEDEIS